MKSSEGKCINQSNGSFPPKIDLKLFRTVGVKGFDHSDQAHLGTVRVLDAIHFSRCRHGLASGKKRLLRDVIDGMPAALEFQTGTLEGDAVAVWPATATEDSQRPC